MPLIIISGFPSSGKTHRSNQLVSYFNDRISSSTDPAVTRLKVVYINDQTLGLDRSVYGAVRSEKDARAALSSAIKRNLSRDTVVVADGMNYIKGWRYQMFCEAKEAGTPSCVIHVGTPSPQCEQLNTIALASKNGGYEQSLFSNLVFRYEEPNGMTRWDSPLFTVPYSDPSPPFEEIWNVLVGVDGKAYKNVRMHAATVVKKPAEQNYLYELDRTTSEIVGAVGAWQRDHPGEGGGVVRIDGGGQQGVEETGVQLPGSGPVALPQLQRLRRQFIAMNRTHEVGQSRIRGLFVDYLNDAFQK